MYALFRSYKDTDHLQFPVLSDEKGDVRKAYGVGKGLFGLTRAGELIIMSSSSNS